SCGLERRDCEQEMFSAEITWKAKTSNRASRSLKQKGSPMIKKRVTKTSAKKAAASVGNLVLDSGTASVATLTTPLTEATQFNGRVHYTGVAAVLVAPGVAFL